MNISFKITPNTNIYNHNSTLKSTPNRIVNNEKYLNFGATYTEAEIRAKQILAKQRRENIKDINDDEYNEIMNYLIDNRSDLNSRYVPNNYFIDKSYCGNIPFEFMGVIPYCGYEDCNKHINNFITGEEKFSSLEKETENEKFISALNYSLDRIDDRYGKYDGIVYRKGRFAPSIPRFYSTSANIPKDDYIYSNLENEFNNKKEINFNVIKLKNGHKLNSMLYEYATSGLKELAEEEDEILIDTKSKFNYLTEKEATPELRELKENYYNIITKELKENHSEEELRNKIKIHLWEEI